MSVQYERSLQQEVIWRTNRYPLIVAPIPNGIWIPAHNERERETVARIINRLKTDGMLIPGMPDLAIIWRTGGGLLELKRPASKDLFGTRSPAGRLSETQKQIIEKCERFGINYGIASHWAEVEAYLIQWGAI